MLATSRSSAPASQVVESEQQAAPATPASPPPASKGAPILKRGDSPRELDEWDRAKRDVKEVDPPPPTTPTPAAPLPVLIRHPPVIREDSGKGRKLACLFR